MNIKPRGRSVTTTPFLTKCALLVCFFVMIFSASVCAQSIDDVIGDVISVLKTGQEELLLSNNPPESIYNNMYEQQLLIKGMPEVSRNSLITPKKRMKVMNEACLVKMKRLRNLAVAESIDLSNLSLVEVVIDDQGPRRFVSAYDKFKARLLLTDGEHKLWIRISLIGENNNWYLWDKLTWVDDKQRPYFGSDAIVTVSEDGAIITRFTPATSIEAPKAHVHTKRKN